MARKKKLEIEDDSTIDVKGGFFVIDRRVWPRVCALGANAAATYILLARGSSLGKRETKWSANAVKTYTGISRPAAPRYIEELVRTGVVVRKAGQSTRKPVYVIPHAHDIIGSDDEPDPKGKHWIWLPNSISDPQETSKFSPLETARLARNNSLAVRILVELYADQIMDEFCGVDPEHVNWPFEGAIVERITDDLVVWGFDPDPEPFVSNWAPFVPNTDEGIQVVRAVLDDLRSKGLLEFVEHVRDGSTDGGGHIVNPFASTSGEPGERRLGAAAHNAGLRLISSEAKARLKPATLLVPLQEGYATPNMVGVLRMKHRANTHKVTAWLEQSEEWEEIAKRYDDMHAQKDAMQYKGRSRMIQVEKGSERA
jgi:hypothetical protein